MILRTGAVFLFLWSLLIIIMGVLFMSSCTYSITLVHTEGEATDVVDETATNTPSTSATIPISLLPKPSL